MENLHRQAWTWARSRLFFLILIFSLFPTSVLAAPQAQIASGGGLQVSNALINIVATPGQVYTHQMAVSNDANSPALDVTVEVRGFGESLDGSFLPLEAAQDISPFSARTFITNVDKPSFRLEPGGSVPLSVTINVPADLGSTTRYAMIYIYSQPVSQGNNVGQILAVSVPVVITPQDAVLDLAGKISELKVADIQSGKPVVILTTVTNKGNHQYKAQGQATITNSAGEAVANLPIPMTNTSIIPTYAQQLRASYSALDRPNGLEPGTYTVMVKVTRDDGSVVDTAQTTFTITAPLQVCPGVDPNHIQVISFTDEEPGVINAREKAHTQLTFEGTGKVTGQVAICEYTQTPSVSPSFEDKAGDGGMAAKGVRFVLIRVDGFNQGKAQVAISYQPGDLAGMNPNSLFLAVKQDGNWMKLENLAVQTGVQVVVGDLSVNQLTQSSLVALGGGSDSEGLSLPVIISVAAAIVLLVLLLSWLFFTRSRRLKK